MSDTTLDIWTDITRYLFRKDSFSTTSVHPLHSCIINGERHYIHSPSLEKEDPGYFAKLKEYAAKHHIKLKADRRQYDSNLKNNRRKKLLPIIFLALGVNAKLAFAEEKPTLSLKMVPDTSVISHEHHDHHKIQSEAHHYSEDHYSHIDTELSSALETILKAHFVSQDDDPTSMEQDIRLIAEYYSMHPEVVSLIESLADEEWSLLYAPHTFQTDIRGTRMQVHEVKVYFDPRSGAKLKFYDKCSDKKPFCVASPADALLHELLHVQTIIKDTKTFISQGGLGRHVYPVEHERATILKENILYRSMSLRDKQPRPIRSDHTGRHVLVSCVTCLD